MGLLTALLVALSRQLLGPRLATNHLLCSPYSFQQVEFGDTFQEVVLQLLWLENIFHFSQGTFNLAITIFRRLLISIKVGSTLKDGNR